MATQFDAASAALFRDGRVLLIKRARAPFEGCWTLPGGRVHRDETAEDCARREVFEELGLRVGPLAFVTEHAPEAGEQHVTLAVFAGAAPDGEIEANEEVTDWRWVAIGGISDLRCTPGLFRIVERASRDFTRA